MLGAKDRAVPVKDAPKATVVLDRLVRTGMEPMASVVLDFAGGRRDGPRRKAKLRAKKDKTMADFGCTTELPPHVTEI